MKFLSVLVPRHLSLGFTSLDDFHWTLCLFVFPLLTAKRLTLPHISNFLQIHFTSHSLCPPCCTYLFFLEKAKLLKIPLVFSNFSSFHLKYSAFSSSGGYLHPTILVLSLLLPLLDSGCSFWSRDLPTCSSPHPSCLLSASFCHVWNTLHFLRLFSLLLGSGPCLTYFLLCLYDGEH